MPVASTFADRLDRPRIRNGGDACLAGRDSRLKPVTLAPRRARGCDRLIIGNILVVDLAFFESRFQEIPEL